MKSEADSRSPNFYEYLSGKAVFLNQEREVRYVYVPKGLEDHHHTFENRTGGDDLLEIWQDENRDSELRKLAWQEHMSRMRTKLLVPSPWPSKEAMENAWRYFQSLSSRDQLSELQHFFAGITVMTRAYEMGREIKVFPETEGRDPYGRYWNSLKIPD